MRILLLILFVCSVPFHTTGLKLSPRIVGGDMASISNFPYQVSLRKPKRDSDGTFYLKHFCSGVIVNQRWILSASHCTSKKKVSVELLWSFVGAQTRDDGYMHKIDQIINHPCEGDHEIIRICDISLVRTRKEIEFTQNVQPIELDSHWIGEGVQVMVSGWGRESKDVRPDRNHSLKSISLTTISNVECVARHTVERKRNIYETTLCAYDDIGIGICYGDSGSALVANDRLIGIASWGKPCAIGKPDQFTRISSFYDWIMEHVRLTD